MKKLFQYFVLGTLSVIPLFVVVQIVFWLKGMGVYLFDFLSFYTTSTVYTVGLIIFVLLFLVLLGFWIRRFGQFFVLSWIEKVLDRIPAIGTVYSISKKVTNMFVQSEDGHKKEVVLIEYPKKDIWVPAYVFNKYENLLVLFIPTSPNPTSGYTVIVDEKLVTKTTLSLEEASTFIVSMGADFVQKEEIKKLIN